MQDRSGINITLKTTRPSVRKCAYGKNFYHGHPKMPKTVNKSKQNFNNCILTLYIENGKKIKQLGVIKNIV